MNRIDSKTWTIAEAGAALAGSGADFVTLFQQGTLEIEIYRPVGVDRQEPHKKDELYVVIAGSGTFVHGDVARQCGYCEQLPLYQRPAPRWAKTYEDAAYRWLLGTDGAGVDVPGVHRIRHIHKGRYGDNTTAAAQMRSNIRRAKERIGT